jgi:predicted RNA polymerase sigma factor
LLARLGRREDARSALLEAVGLCGNAVERAALERKVDGLS